MSKTYEANAVSYFIRSNPTILFEFI